MTQPIVDILLRIEALLRVGKKQEARLLLTEYLRSNPASARAWWLMSQAVTDLNQQMDCLQHVLKLDPGNIPAHEQLGKLKAAKSQTSPASAAAFFPEPTPPEAKAPAGSAPIVTPPGTISAPPVQSSTTEEVTAPASPAPAEPAGEESPSVGKSKKRWWIPDVVMIVLLIIGISFIASYLLKEQKTKSANVQATSLQGTRAVALLLTKLPTLTSTPTLTASPTLTIKPSATPTETQTPTVGIISTKTPPPASLISPEVGFYAPDFSLLQIGIGLKASLSQVSGKAVLIYFWDTRSSTCLAEVEPLKTLQQNYADKGLVILAINASESSSTVVTYVNTNHLTYRVLLDQRFATQTLYQVTLIPTHFFIDPDGKITYIGFGGMSYKQMEPLVKAILP